MKIIIDDKEFFGRFEFKDLSNRIVIDLNKDEDKIFFAKWQKRTLPTRAENTDTLVHSTKPDIKVTYEQVTKCGELEGCVPILDINEDFVTLICDTNKSKYIV